MFARKPLLLTFARALSICLGLSVLGYLVYCAHRDARVAEPEREVFLPSSKAVIPPPLDPKTKEKEKKAPTKKKKNPPKQDIFIPSSKSGVLRMPLPNTDATSG